MITGLFPIELLAAKKSAEQLQVAYEEVLEEVSEAIAAETRLFDESMHAGRQNQFGDVSYAQRCSRDLARAMSLLHTENPEADLSVTVTVGDLVTNACRWWAWRKVQADQANETHVYTSYSEPALDKEPEPEPENKPTGLRSLLKRPK